jgi:hypothetical protein
VDHFCVGQARINFAEHLRKKTKQFYLSRALWELSFTMDDNEIQRKPVDPDVGHDELMRASYTSSSSVDDNIMNPTTTGTGNGAHDPPSTTTTATGNKESNQCDSYKLHIRHDRKADPPGDHLVEEPNDTEDTYGQSVATTASESGEMPTPRVSARQDASASTDSGSKRSVKFDSVEVREHSLIDSTDSRMPNDNSSTSMASGRDNPTMELCWEARSISISTLDDYEASRASSHRSISTESMPRERNPLALRAADYGEFHKVRMLTAPTTTSTNTPPLKDDAIVLPLAERRVGQVELSDLAEAPKRRAPGGFLRRLTGRPKPTTSLSHM